MMNGCIILKNNPFYIQEPIVPNVASNILHNAMKRHLMNQDSYINAGEDQMCRSAAQIFNGLCETLPTISSIKMSEDEHCNRLLKIHINNIFTAHKKYEVRFNRSVLGTSQRPDFSCVINDVPFLLSEIKPIGTSPLLKQMDFRKIHLRGKNALNQQLNKKGGPGQVMMLVNAGELLKTYVMNLQNGGLYVSWSLITSKLATDVSTMPLIDFNFKHFIKLEKCVDILVNDYVNCEDIST
ncbi:20176_t:CDS:2 [Entrophospora sp. SA101]|nr:18743_t:CDS:2 [Entrophospora sp. SA101]CAJ0751256.1 20176_t:CDS:2 [Entrophospora sp. SA101]